MSSITGHKLKVSIFGESHGPAIGVVLDSCPPGISLDLGYIREEMKRRQPGKSKFTSTRAETDNFEILSGYFRGKTTGTPLCALIYNRDQRSVDYEDTKQLPRPGHADYTGNLKYAGHNDHRGGGHFSGRLTAPLVFAGAVAKDILRQQNIFIGSHIKSIHNIMDDSFDGKDVGESLLLNLRKAGCKQLSLPVLCKEAGQKMAACILEAKGDKDSVGGVIETAVINVPPGLGSPMFRGVESRLSQVLFSIPAVKGVEFGMGFGVTRMTGREANDEYTVEKGRIKTTSNHNGGILGGITNGMPLIFSTAVKPTPSIGKGQKTVNIETMETARITIKGRHDPCIVPRAIPVVEGAAALVILDLILERNGEDGGIG